MSADLNQFLYTPAAQAAGRMRLHFSHHDKLASSDQPMSSDISGLSADGEWLWLVSDETTSVERLRRVGDDYAEHRSFEMGDFFDLPGKTEIDLEGLAYDNGWLWLVGSHALKRKKPRPESDSTEETLSRLNRVVQEINRYFLARLPLEMTDDGPCPVVEAKDGRRAGMVRIKKNDNDLSRKLKKDPHLGVFVDIPAKENGLDIEGIAASGDRVLLGLRGPVLRGMAVLLEVALKDKGDGRLRLDKKAFDTDEPYRKHFIDLGGMGVRDLTLEGKELYMLVGPTMDLDGPVAILSLPEPFSDLHEVTPGSALRQVIRIPHGGGTDHAEGMTRLPDGRFLIVYDSPDPTRLFAEGQSMDADVFEISP
jgi:hypothetical protein